MNTVIRTAGKFPSERNRDHSERLETRTLALRHKSPVIELRPLHTRPTEKRAEPERSTISAAMANSKTGAVHRQSDRTTQGDEDYAGPQDTTAAGKTGFAWLR